MKRLLSFVNSVLPYRITHILDAAYRNVIFRRAIRKFLQNPGAYKDPGNPVLKNLVYGWSNEAWSAQDEYLAGCIDHALSSRGPILECGSGLSTILVGAIATTRGLSYWVLEHSSEWATKVQHYLNRYKLDSVVLRTTPLKDYGDFCWYDAPLESMPDRFSLVICDGPPGTTKGGRYGLAHVMRQRLEPGCVILLDDAAREQELAIAGRWKMELDGSLEILGSDKPYIRMTVRTKPQQKPARLDAITGTVLPAAIMD